MRYCTRISPSLGKPRAECHQHITVEQAISPGELPELRREDPTTVRLAPMRFHPTTLRCEVKLRFPKGLVELGYTAPDR